MTLYELCRRDVVDLSTGANLGSVDDIDVYKRQAI